MGMAAYRLGFHRLRHTLSGFQSVAMESAAIKVAAETEPLQMHPRSTLDLSDTQKLFSCVPTSTLLRSTINLQLASMDKIVDLGVCVMNSRVMTSHEHRDSWIRKLMLGVLKHTFFEHFCAGENTSEAMQCLGRLSNTGLRGMLDFAIEFAPDGESCDQNFDLFMETIEHSSSSSASVSCVVVKITALYPLHLLERISDLLRWQHKQASFQLPWRENNFPIFSDRSPLYHTPKEPPALSPGEEKELFLGWTRFSKLCQRCAEVNIPLVVDAEHTQVQPAIDYVTYSAAIAYNKEDRTVVYNTIQAYLKDAEERLLLATKASEKMGVQMGFKLVRGAYMTTERKVAKGLNCQSPIHNSVYETHACYNACASFLLEKISAGAGAAILATHNVESGRLAAIKAHDLGIGKDGSKLEFAQLYGMADALSFGLKNAGFQVSKYMPYGPVDTVIPYLIRRAEENRGMLSSSRLDRELMRKELKRRLREAF